MSVPVLDVGKNNVDNVDNLVYNWFLRKKEVFLCGQKRNILSKESVDNVENVEKNLCSCAIC